MTDEERVLAYIDLDALDFNIKSIKKRATDKIGIIGVIKADAYGHGAVEASGILLENGVTMLAAAVVDEALKLRENGIDVPVLLLGYTPEGRMEDVVKYDLIQSVFSMEMAEKLSRAAVKQNKTAVVHIKIDTGMGRIGYRVNEESADEILKISKLPNLKIDGIFTHFATADEADKEFTHIQLERFKKMNEMLTERGLDIRVRHCSNSAAIIDFEEIPFEMARPGIILYGAYPSDEVIKQNLELKPVMSIKTHISYVKPVSEGDSISYGRTYVADSDRVIATIPVGYADGIIRAYAKGGKVLVHGQYAPITGRICMDQFMIDVTDIPDVKVDDEVVLMGKQGENEITADFIAEVMNTINYEVFCNISKRVPRVYVRNGETVGVTKYV